MVLVTTLMLTHTAVLTINKSALSRVIILAWAATAVVKDSKVFVRVLVFSKPEPLRITVAITEIERPD